MVLQSVTGIVGKSFPDFTFIACSGIHMFLGAPLYLLAASRVPKHGTIFIFIALFGVVQGIMGYWFMIPYFLIAALVCELFMIGGNTYKSFWRNTLAWIVCSVFYYIANGMPVWLIWEIYQGQMQAGGASEEYLTLNLFYFTSPLWLSIICMITIGLAVLGMLFGRKLLHKHFVKAGLV